MSICRFWYLRGSENQPPTDTKGPMQLSFGKVRVIHGFSMCKGWCSNPAVQGSTILNLHLATSKERGNVSVVTSLDGILKLMMH